MLHERRLGKGFWAILAVVILLVCVGLGYYNDMLKKNLTAAMEKGYTEVAQMQKMNFETKVGGEMTSLQNLAGMVASTLAEKDRMLAALSQAQDQSNFDFYVVADLGGKGLTTKGVAVDLGGADYFEQARKGSANIGQPLLSPLDRTQKMLPFAQPIYHKDILVGVLAGYYSADRLDTLLLPIFEGSGQTLVINRKGELIAGTMDRATHAGNIVFDALADAKFAGGLTLPELRGSIINGESGGVQYQIGDKRVYIQYVPLQMGNWQMLSFVSEREIGKNYQVLTGNAIGLTVGIALAFLGVNLMVLYMRRHMNQERKQHYTNLERVAYSDELTGAPNLTKFRLEAAKRLRENQDIRLVCVKLDIVNFRVINEVYGAEIGNQLIRVLTECVRDAVANEKSKYNTYGRVYADELVLVDITMGATATEEKRAAFDKNFAELASPLVGGQRLALRYGICYIGKGETDIRDIMERVNFAHRLSKTGKYGNVCVYDDTLKSHLLVEAGIERTMHKALEEQEFHVFLQGKYGLAQNKQVGAEALVRWIKPEGDMVMPAAFIDQFERNGFITKLDFYMLGHVCAFLQKRIQAEKIVVPISVNFSRLHLGDPNFATNLDAIVSGYAIPKKLIEIELTERTMFENEDKLIGIFLALRQLGYTLSMDDFGKGYSSLGLLKKLPVDVVKLDRDFFSEDIQDKRAQIVIESTLQMARNLGIQTVAEGVEDLEQAAYLRSVGCDMIQGFCYARPKPMADFFAELDLQ